MCLHIYLFIVRSISTLEDALFFFKCMVNEHLFVNLVSLSKKINLNNIEIWQRSVCFKTH